MRITEDDPCELWTGSLDHNGYGRATFNGKAEKAHRVSWFIDRGRIPNRMRVLHNCDVYYTPGDMTYRACFRLNHLYLGTHEDNMIRMVETGRVCKGEKCHDAVLTQLQVDEIRERYIPGVVRQVDLANEYGVCQSHISSIVRGVKWK